MNNNISLKIVVAETSVIVRSGLAAVLKRIPNLNAHPIEVSSPEALQNFIHLHTPDIVIVNPTFGGWFDLPSFKTNHNGNSIKYIALVCSVIDNNALKEYDESIAICDDIEMITTKINRLLHTEEEDEKDSEQETLSQREKEIITCVVKGMTNKAIADKLYLSIHTVITHRRNIARKLQIHSPAGLTIYAIVNKLVELSDGFTGADLESTVRELAYHRLADENGKLSDDDVISTFENVVPLSKTSPEKIEDIRDWGRERAVPASGRPIGEETLPQADRLHVRRVLTRH